MKKAFFWIGDSHTGKSTFTRVLKEILGFAATTHSLNQISSKHGPADLEYAKVNICQEIERKKINSMDNFKAIIGNDPISVEPKFQSLHTMNCRLNILLVGNDFMPLAKGVGEPALYNRIVPIRFLNPYDEDEQDELFDQRLLECERDKIGSFIIRHLRELRGRKYKFNKSKLSDMEKRRFIRQNSPSDSVEYFIADVCEFVPDYFTPSASIYADYEKYCNVNGFDPERKNAFFVKFASRFDIKSSRTRDNFTHKQRRGYKGIKIRREDIYPGTPSRL